MVGMAAPQNTLMAGSPIREQALAVAILTTGGTIEKTYNEIEGSLGNERSVLSELLGALRLPQLRTKHVPVLSKDSLDLTDDDRWRIVAAVRAALPECDAVLVVHGTDTLAVTGEWLCRELPVLDKPVVLTGAMRPYEFRDSDALQNVTEALLTCRLAAPGVYVAMHNQVIRFPGVVKNRKQATFERASGGCP